MSTVIFYHRGCPDGACAAWVCKKAIKERDCKESRSIECIPLYAGKPLFLPNQKANFSSFTDKHIIFVDVFPRPADIVELQKVTASITILDHHLTSLEDVKLFIPRVNKDKFIVDLSFAGCSLAWNYYFPHLPLPFFVANIADQDIQAKKLVDSKAICKYLAGTGISFDVDKFDSLLNLDKKQEDKILAKGKMVMELESNHINFLISKARMSALDVNGEGYSVIFGKCSASLIGDVTEKLLADKKYNDAEIVCLWRYNDELDCFTISCRGREGGVNIAQLCREMGGGGHLLAGSFNIPNGKGILQTVFPVIQ